MKTIIFIQHEMKNQGDHLYYFDRSENSVVGNFTIFCSIQNVTEISTSPKYFSRRFHSYNETSIPV